MLTYGEIYKKFLNETKIPESLINDFRPCSETYGVPHIDNSILLWLNSGTRIIYIVPEDNKSEK